MVRRTVHGFYLRKEYPSAENVLKELYATTDNEFPQMCVSTFKKILTRLGFYYRKYNKRPMFMESYDVVNNRCAFLREMKFLRSDGWKIFYTDETWCGANHCRTYGWQEKITERDALGYNRDRGCIQEVNGWKGGLKTPSGAGKRVIACHVGSEDGFLEGVGVELCFVGRKGSADYHNEMNSRHYTERFQNVIEKIPDKSAIVIDRAPYHTMGTEDSKNPSTSWLKSEIVEWVYSNNVPLPSHTEYPEQLTRPELLALCRPYLQVKVKVLERLVQQSGKRVRLVWLPVAHCELNAIELIWANVKGFVAGQNKTFNVNNVLDLFKQGLRRIDDKTWKAAVSHVKKIEDHYREKHHVLDMAIEPLVIRVRPQDDDSSASDADEDNSDESS